MWGRPKGRPLCFCSCETWGRPVGAKSPLCRAPWPAAYSLADAWTVGAENEPSDCRHQSVGIGPEWRSSAAAPVAPFENGRIRLIFRNVRARSLV